MVKYSDEFKADAVALVHAGNSQSQVCRDLGLSKSTISNWVAAEERTRLGLPASNGVDSDENKQIQALISRNRLLEQENEVLRRAAAYLSQIHIKNPK